MFCNTLMYVLYDLHAKPCLLFLLSFSPALSLSGLRWGQGDWFFFRRSLTAIDRIAPYPPPPASVCMHVWVLSWVWLQDAPWGLQRKLHQSKAWDHTQTYINICVCLCYVCVRAPLGQSTGGLNNNLIFHHFYYSATARGGGGGGAWTSSYWQCVCISNMSGM